MDSLESRPRLEIPPSLDCYARRIVGALGCLEADGLRGLGYGCLEKGLVWGYLIRVQAASHSTTLDWLVAQVLRHDIKDSTKLGKMKEVAPNLILDNFSSSLGERVCNVLKHLFPVPKPETKRIITFANDSDYISFRLHCALGVLDF